MSENVNVKINGATSDILKKGAKEYGCVVNGNVVNITSQNHSMQAVIQDNGSLSGDFYMIHDLNGHALNTKGERAVADEITGRFVQAGAISEYRSILGKEGYSVSGEPISGKLLANRGEESLSIEVDINGKAKYDANGFSGDSCVTQVDKLIATLGNTQVTKRTPKTQPQQVITNIQEF